MRLGASSKMPSGKVVAFISRILYTIRHEKTRENNRWNEKIETMETGKLCLMRKSATGREYYNIQTWKDGRNVSRYVPESELEETKRAVANHGRFMALVGEYVDLVVKRTWAERDRRRKNAKA